MTENTIAVVHEVPPVSPEVMKAASEYAASFGRWLILDWPGVGFLCGGFHWWHRWSRCEPLTLMAFPYAPEVFEPTWAPGPVRKFQLHVREVLPPNAGPKVGLWRGWRGSAFLFDPDPANIDALLFRAKRTRVMP